MTTNPTQRHTARPSRLRVSLARVAGALGRACDYCERHLVASSVVLGTLASVALAFVVAFDDDRAAVAVVAVAVCAFIAFIAFIATDDALTRAYAKAHRASVARIVATHDAARAEWHAYCDGMATRYEELNARNIARRNDALNDRDLALREMRNAQRECDRMARDMATLGERMSGQYDAMRRERDALARLALRMSGIDLPHGVTIHDASLEAFYIARGEHESSDDMNERDYRAACERLTAYALTQSRA